MDFNQLESFVRSYETGSLSKAAADLFLAQTSLAHRINSLEHELGCTLFVRNKRGIFPTTTADALYPHAKDLVARGQAFVRLTRTVSDATRKELRIGFNRYPNVPLFFEAIDHFKKDNPDVSVKIDLSYINDAEEALVRGEYDIVYIFDYDHAEFDPFEFLVLGSFGYCAIMAQTHPLASRETLRLQDFNGDTLRTLKQFANTRFQVPSLDGAQQLGIAVDSSAIDNESMFLALHTEGGFGVYPASTQAIRPGFVHVPLIDHMPLEHGILFNRSALTPSSQRFVAFVTDHMTPQAAHAHTRTCRP